MSKEVLVITESGFVSLSDKLRQLADALDERRMGIVKASYSMHGDITEVEFTFQKLHPINNGGVS